MPAAPRTDHTHVLLLRGINVGGHAKVPMVHLRRIAAAAGAAEVTTHLNSGNVLFRVPGFQATDSGATDSGAMDSVARQVATGVQAALERELDLAIPVIPASRDELDTALVLHEQLEFAGGQDRLTHLAILAEPADPAAARRLEAFDAGPDRCAVTDRFAWIRYADSSRSSRLSLDRIERTLGVPATARNLLTVRRLAGLR